MKVDLDIIEILKNCSVKENYLFLGNESLDRKIYLKIMKVLSNLDIKWSKKLKCHICLKETNLKESIDNLIETGEYIDIKKEYQFFETPIDIVKEMILLSNFTTGSKVLEPSAGKGRIILNLPNLNLKIDAIELNVDTFKYLNEIVNSDQVRHSNINVINEDFMDIDLGLYSNIIMNPPFSKNQDIKHILKAYSLLSDNGILVGIVGSGAIDNSREINKAFRKFLKENNAEVIDLESGRFKQSGTMVESKIVKIVKKAL